VNLPPGKARLRRLMDAPPLAFAPRTPGNHLVGFAIKFLWIVAAIVLAVWLIGFLARGAEARWYRW
jgi:hypothetical protein